MKFEFINQLKVLLRSEVCYQVAKYILINVNINISFQEIISQGQSQLFANPNPNQDMFSKSKAILELPE